MGLKLEVFAVAQKNDAPSTVVLDTMELEEAKLASYDSGYAAGWEDAASAQLGDQSKITTDLARNLQTLSFTYHEARSHVLRALEPLLQEMVNRLLPELARETLAPIILEALMPLAEKAADTPITLVLNPVARPAVEALLEHSKALPLSLVEETSLGEGQAYLRLGRCETQIDLGRATVEIAAAVRGFFEILEKDRHDG